MNSKGQDVAGIVLAAGEGRRIGKNKALLKMQGVTFLERVVTCLCGAGCAPVVVVGGADADTVRGEAEKLGVRFALNADWRSGQFSSVKTGMSHLGSDMAGVMVALVDHPVVADKTYRLLLETFRSSPGSIIIPSHQGRRGHPVVIPREVMEEIADSPGDLTLRDIMRKRVELILVQAVDDDGILKDIDTEGDLQRFGQKRG